MQLNKIIFKYRLKKLLNKIQYKDYEDFKNDIYDYIEEKNRKKFYTTEEEINYLVKKLGYHNFNDFYYSNTFNIKKIINTNYINIYIIIMFFIGLITLSVFTSSSDSINHSILSSSKNEEIELNSKTEEKDTKEKICDGTVITSNCTIDGIEYEKYVYHAAIPEKSHIETIITYTTEITGYCTLCNDGTRSPSCATGKGACSHHGGVAEWNAPIYTKVEHKEQKIVIDSEEIPEYYEKIEKQ